MATIVAIGWKEKLGQEIRHARKQKGITQEEFQQALLAAGLSLSTATIKYYESGKRSPDFGDLRAIAEVLGVDYFEVDDNIRVDFSPNGKLPLEQLPQQLMLDMDAKGKLNIRRQPTNHGAIVRKIRA